MVEARLKWVLPEASALALFAVLVAVPAQAQPRPARAADLALGTLLFADDGVVREGLVAGDVRAYVTPRISIGPEAAFIRGQKHSHLMLTGNVTYDLVPLSNGQPRSVTPFVVVGGGLFQTREQFPNRETFTSTEGAFTAGGALRAPIGQHVALGAEARVGWELHVRLNALISVRFGKPR